MGVVLLFLSYVSVMVIATRFCIRKELKTNLSVRIGDLILFFFIGLFWPIVSLIYIVVNWNDVMNIKVIESKRKQSK